MPESSLLHRPLCPRCQHPARRCLCRWITPTDNTLPLLVLQHPLEQHHAKGSLPLLRLSLAQCRVEVGECFDAQALATWLGEGSWLLYPGAEAAATAATAAPRQLVLLDGTWRKTRKLLHLNPLLRQLPRCSLPASAPPLYRIRKSHLPEQRSTLEAACLALGQTEDRVAQYAPLMQAFGEWVDNAALAAGSSKD